MKVETVAELRCHTTTSCNEVSSIYAHIRRADAELEIGFRLEGNLSRIRLSAPAEAGDQVELWRHTCFEAFVAIEGQIAYQEFNFAPSREWRVYRFRAYRDHACAPSLNGVRSPIVDVRAKGSRLELDVRIGLRSLSEHHSASPLRLGVSAIIEPCNGPLSYWALRHPAARPDFHHPDAFALRLQAPVHG